MTTFSEFLPMDRRAALAAGHTLPDRAAGAALFADISGFTPLTAALVGEFGPDRGAEVLTEQLNLVFGALITHVHDHRGSVIGFSGDAITCWFEADDGRRAVTAALAMQSVISSLDPTNMPAGDETLVGIKVAVSSGMARRFLVGIDGIPYVEALAGSILDRTAVGETLARQGEIIVSQEVPASLGSDLIISAERVTADGHTFYVVSGLDNQAEPDPWPETVPLPVEQMRFWILPPIYERLKLGADQFVSELRQATALFLRFTGIDYDGDDDAGTKLNAFVCWVQSVLDRYEASLIQVTFGDKGSYIFAVFGAPVAHEDDTARALSAALDLRRPANHLDFISGIQIGINRGLLYAGTYGGGGSLTYGILGDATNVAARLMQQAEVGQILIPARLVQAGGPAFESDDLGQLTMKGLWGPMKVVSIVGYRAEDAGGILARPPSEDSVIGRNDEKAVINDSLEALAAGASRTLIIEGEAGIGKSHLIKDMSEHAGRLGVAVFEGAGDAIEQSSPYFAWRRIIQAALFDNRLQDLTVSEVNDAVITRLQTIDPDLVRLAPLMNTVLPIDLPENELTQNMSGEVRAENLGRLLTAVLAYCASSTPLIVVLDDAHWLDSASWNLARITARHVSPLMLVIASRPQTAPSAEYVYLQQTPLSRLLCLDLLSAEEILAICCQRLGVDSLPEPIARLILDKAEGQPFFSEELAYALRDAGHIRIETGRAYMVTEPQELEHLNFPDTIQGVITSRIDRLSAKEQLTVKVASVIGRIFAYQILRDIYPVRSNDEELHEELVQLEQLDITVLETPDPQLAYIFRHIITQEVTYGLLTFSQRKPLHRATAEWYENQYAAELDSYYPLMVYHWKNAEAPLKARQYLELAGIQALRNNANEEAIRFFLELRALDETADLGSDDLTRAKWARLLAEAYFAAGEIPKGREHYEEALGILGQPLPGSQGGLNLALLRESASQTIHRLWSARFAKAGREDPYVREAAHIYHGLAVIHYFNNEALAFTHAALRALNLAEKTAPSRELAEGYATLCVITSMVPGLNVAESYARKALETAELLGDPSILGNVWLRILVYHNGEGHWVDAQEAGENAIANYKKINDMRGWGDSVNALMHMLTIHGRFEESAKLNRELYQAAVENDNTQHQDWGLWMEGTNLLYMGRIEEAIQQIETAIALEVSSANELQILFVYGPLALAYWRLGEIEKAVDLLQKVDISMAAATPTFAALSPISNVAETYMLAWEANQKLPASVLNAKQAEIISGAEQSCKAIKSYSRIFPIGKPAFQLNEGRLEWLKKKPDKAYKAWAKCIALAEDLDMPFELAQAELELGLRLPDEDASKRDHLQRAFDVFRGLDATWHLERAQAALGQP